MAGYLMMFAECRGTCKRGATMRWHPSSVVDLVLCGDDELVDLVRVRDKLCDVFADETMTASAG